MSKKPTLEEVKEYFKDAETIKSKYSGIIVDNNGKFRKGNFDSDFYLDSCGGIEVWSLKNGYAKILTHKEPKEESFVISKEQVVSIYNSCKKQRCYSAMNEIKLMFPSAFEPEKKELVVGKWYFIELSKSQFNDKQKALIFYEDKTRLYGFSHLGIYTNNYSNPKNNKYTFTEATQQEVEEALKAEAVKRGFINGIYVNPVTKNWGRNIKLYLEHNDPLFWVNSIGDLMCCGVQIFHKGQWAEIIQTITKEQAEKELGKKIIN